MKIFRYKSYIPKPLTEYDHPYMYALDYKIKEEVMEILEEEKVKHGALPLGGQRVPCIIRWPGKINEGQQTDALSTTMDFLPSITKLIGGKPSFKKN